MVDFSARSVIMASVQAVDKSGSIRIPRRDSKRAIYSRLLEGE